MFCFCERGLLFPPADVDLHLQKIRRRRLVASFDLLCVRPPPHCGHHSSMSDSPMTDEPSSDNSAEFPPAPPAASNGRANGGGGRAPEASRATVRSGLANRRSPVLASIGAGLQNVRRIA